MPAFFSAPWSSSGSTKTRKEITVRIAQIAPLAEAVPPKLYGGTERVVSWLTEELVAEGHEVTLFASGDPKTSAKLVPCVPQGLRLAGIHDDIASHLVMLDNRPPARRSVRRDPFPYRSPAIPPIPGSRPQVRDYAATVGSISSTFIRSITPFPICRWSRFRTTSGDPCLAM